MISCHEESKCQYSYTASSGVTTDKLSNEGMD
uniref:Uncharacterized protein n=1 Tax=Arundo donax TaxID=35708 RepID=A0A0A9H6P2_ARUDO